MGNAMGNFPNNGWNLYFHPEVTPSPTEEPSFDPLMGFEGGRKKRGKNCRFIFEMILQSLMCFLCICRNDCYR